MEQNIFSHYETLLALLFTEKEVEKMKSERVTDKDSEKKRLETIGSEIANRLENIDFLTLSVENEEKFLKISEMLLRGCGCLGAGLDLKTKKMLFESLKLHV